MNRKLLVVAALVLIGGAAVLFLASSRNSPATVARDQFVQQRGGRFFVGNKPFRFVGANVAVMYRDEDRARMPETLQQAAQAGIKVVRVWAFGEGGPNDVKPMADFPAHWDPKLRIPRGQVVAAASIVSPKY